MSYLNDLEMEQRQYYRNWDRSFFALLNVFPGSLPRLARNLFNVIYVIDPGSAEGLRFFSPLVLRAPREIVSHKHAHFVQYF